jgi:hypothetical protein
MGCSLSVIGSRKNRNDLDVGPLFDRHCTLDPIEEVTEDLLNLAFFSFFLSGDNSFWPLGLGKLELNLALMSGLEPLQSLPLAF